jgi:hypothetical protein
MECGVQDAKSTALVNVSSVRIVLFVKLRTEITSESASASESESIEMMIGSGRGLFAAGTSSSCSSGGGGGGGAGGGGVGCCSEAKDGMGMVRVAALRRIIPLILILRIILPSFPIGMEAADESVLGSCIMLKK